MSENAQSVNEIAFVQHFHNGKKLKKRQQILFQTNQIKKLEENSSKLNAKH